LKKKDKKHVFLVLSDVADPGCLSQIRIFQSQIPEPGVKKSLNPGYGSATPVARKIYILSVLRIQIHWIHMFLGLPDPDPLVRCMDPDPDQNPSIVM
jgi:hypothetical protein